MNSGIVTGQDQQQKMLEGIAGQGQEMAGNIYQSFMGSLANAAALAGLPKWRETLESEFARFEHEADVYANEFKDSLEKQLPPEGLLPARGAVTIGIDRAKEAAAGHRNALISLIEQLRGESDSSMHRGMVMDYVPFITDVIFSDVNEVYMSERTLAQLARSFPEELNFAEGDVPNGEPLGNLEGMIILKDNGLACNTVVVVKKAGM